MSNFQDNFHRDEEQTLDYDDSAFYYFFIAILTCVLVPVTIRFLSKMIFGESKINTKGQNCQCSRCKSLLESKQKEVKKSWVRAGFIFKLAVLVFFWYVWYLTADMIGKIEPLKSFDPYQILGVSPDAELSVIKRAYRKLSLEKHPDKNPDDPLAVSEFIQISKAYQTLTDDTARENYQKYGNPDGPGSFHVAIALPRFLLQKEYQVSVLACFFLVLLVIIPGYFYMSLDQSSKDVGNVSIANRQIFAHFINENLIYKHCPTIIAHSIEFQGGKVKSLKEQEVLNKLKVNEHIRTYIPRETSKKGQSVERKPLLILLAYLYQVEELDELEQEEINGVLRRVPFYIEIMLNVANGLSMQYKMTRGYRGRKVLARNIITILEFSQNAMQGLWKDSDAMEQLPHFNYDKIKELRKKKGKVRIEDFCKMTPQQRQELELFDNPKQLQDVEMAIKSMPLIELKVTTGVAGEQEVAVGDILTIRVEITQVNLQEGQQSGFSHSNTFPFLKKNHWYLIMMDKDENEFFHLERFTLHERVFVKEIKDQMRMPGKFMMKFKLMNDSHKGFDKEYMVEVNVQKGIERKPDEIHEEDIQAMKQPGLMQQMLDPNQVDSDDEEEEEEESPEKKKVDHAEDKKEEAPTQ